MTQKLSLFAQVRALPERPAVAFAATLCERMAPNYQLFCQLTEFSDGSQWHNSLTSVWEWLSQPKAKINFALQLEKMEEQVPDVQDFDHYGVYPALDAAMSLCAILQMLTGQDPQGAVVASKLSQGSVEAYIGVTSETPLDSQTLRQHPLMQWELSFQQELLDTLAKEKLTPELCKRLQAMAHEEGISNIGVSVEE